MASLGQDLSDGEQLVSHRTSRQGVGGQDVDHNDHVRSWLGATTALDYPSAPLDGINHVGSSQQSLPQSLTSHGDQVEPLEAGELPPAYQETDPAKDYPSTYEFEIDDSGEQNANLYTPFFLRISVLIAFVFTFAAMLIAVEVMKLFSKHQRGLAIQDPDKHYLWTFGPTLFLTIVACFWGQVEYRAKQLMPWKAMGKGPVPAEDSILLDYVSPWNVTAMVTAFKKKHVAVVLAILGSILIKLAIIFSAGFLSIGYDRVFSEGVAMEVRDTFMTSSSYANASNIQPVIAAIGASQYGLPFPPGTTESFATQSYFTVENATDLGTILIANVDVFFADLWCETGIVSQISTAQCTAWNSTNNCETVSYNITVSSNSCTTNSSQVSVSVDKAGDQYYGSVTSSACIDSESDDIRLTFLTGHEWIGDSAAGNVTGSTALICTPTYDVCEYSVESFLNGTVSDICACNGTCFSPPSALDLASTILDMVQYASTSSLVLFEEDTTTYNGSYVNLDVFFQLMNATAMPENVAAFQNSTYLEASAQQLFATLAAGIAKGELMMPSGEPIYGSTLAHQQVLFVREISLRLLEIVFASLMIITLVLLLLRPVASTPADVSTVAGFASVLARSPRVVTAVQGLGPARFEDIRQRLMGRTFHTTVSNTAGPTFRLTSVTNSHNTEESRPSGPALWWRPISLSIFVRVSLVVLSLALIAILEAVYQISDRYDGFANVFESGSVLYAWTYLPPFAMVLASIGYEAVHLNTRLLQPYKTLREGPALADKSIVVNYLSCLTPVATWKAISKRHYAVINSGLIMMFASLLVVVSSGLYQADLVDKLIPATISVNDTIDNAHAWSSADPANSNRARTVSILIAEANMSFVSWTYGGYVLPLLNRQAFLDAQFEDNDEANTTSVRVQSLPAYSAAMNCEISNFETTSVIQQTGRSYADIMVQVPSGCGNATTDGDYWDLGNKTLTAGLHDYGIAYIRKNATMPSTCPQVALVYGQASVYPVNSSVEWDLVAAYCTPTVYTVMVNVTFNMPAFSIVSVDADMTTETIISRGGAGNATLNIEDWLPATDWGVDSFYGGLTPGREGIAWSDLIGQSNFHTFSRHADALYAIMYSQWLNIYGRVNAAGDDKPLDALIIDPTRTRLMQSAVSTRLLEVLLAALAICTVVGYFLLDTKEVLPFSPCSVAAMSALLADSNILKTIPEGAEWYDEKELTKRRTFSEYLYRLGWFQGGDGSRRFGIHTGSGDEGVDAG